MRSGHFSLVAGFGLLLAAGSAAAHHSWARYDADTLITVTGTITKLEWASPHVFIYFEAMNEAGAPVAWAMELDPPVLLRRYGLVREMVEEGAKITVTGVAAKSGAAMMRGLRIELADGTDIRVSSRI
jgi:hypothetical protein